ncbi:MAG: transaldolase [Phycisphaerae bacterium]
MNNRIHELSATGQSIWCDNISRSMIDGGELARLIEQGIVGVTSNPTIFMKAITSGRDYDDAIARCWESGQDIMNVYEALVLPDIADAADLLRPVYDRTDRLDGYVSLEVNPQLAADTSGTIDEARRLWDRLNRPNIFIKVPATNEGIPAIKTLISEGINVNVTLIFSLEMYKQVVQAYIAGLRKRAGGGEDIRSVASVASFFVSRVDGPVDARLNQKRSTGQNVDHLLGKAAVANARLAYGVFRHCFATDGPFADLAAAGARVQRPLWASTSTKNPDYPDTKYCDELVAPHTVNTLPPATIAAVLDHGSTTAAIAPDLPPEEAIVDELRGLGIDMGQVTDQLRVDGVAAFAKSFMQLLDNLTEKCRAMRVTR